MANPHLVVDIVEKRITEYTDALLRGDLEELARLEKQMSPWPITYTDVVREPR